MKRTFAIFLENSLGRNKSQIRRKSTSTFTLRTFLSLSLHLHYDPHAHALGHTNFSAHPYGFLLVNESLLHEEGGDLLSYVGACCMLPLIFFFLTHGILETFSSENIFFVPAYCNRCSTRWWRVNITRTVNLLQLLPLFCFLFHIPHHHSSFFFFFLFFFFFSRRRSERHHEVSLG